MEPQALTRIVRLRVPSWWPNLVWRHDPGELFGFMPIRKLMGVAFGPDVYFGLVVTKRDQID